MEDGTPLSPAIGITGGIGTGKSAVARIFERRGARVLDADRIGHEVLREPGVKDALVAAFGVDILGEDGEISRSALGGRVFGDPEALGTLNGTVHPRLLGLLGEQLESARRAPDVPLVVVDAALITEWGIEDWFDAVIVVSTPEETVRKRLRAKGLDADQIDRRIGSQLGESERIRRATDVIRNDRDVDAMESAVERIWRRMVR